jgi:hypothetical protein
MNNELQVVPSNLPTATGTAPQTLFDNRAENVNQIANMAGGIVNVSYHVHASGSTRYNPLTPRSTELYNLFVLAGDETFDDPFFLMPRDRALTINEGIAPDISARYSPLSPEAIAEIMTFPSIFASENRSYGRTTDDHMAHFGMVTDVRVQENGIKVYYHAFNPIPQQRLNEIAFNLAIKSASSFNELNRTHWAIKRIHLVEELTAARISILLPT